MAWGLSLSDGLESNYFKGKYLKVKHKLDKKDQLFEVTLNAVNLIFDRKMQSKVFVTTLKLLRVQLWLLIQTDLFYL